MKFKLEIELGNDGMRTKEHLQLALREVAEALKDAHAFGGEGRIKDSNGNTVGKWSLR
jgi:hypothetical protein